ncbi:thiamine-phosphate kinase [Brevibacterium litoralis]|uniref:thiamine-phosphate kinase n=1 Tax=Brevibacterium litoralis TaxID=3138935 RepID=UPI0032ECAB05
MSSWSRTPAPSASSAVPPTAEAPTVDPTDPPAEDPTLAQTGEDGVLDRILRVLAEAPAGSTAVSPERSGRDGTHDGPRVLVGPGDDAAVVRVPGDLVTTTDMLVEGQDFLADWLDPYRLGVKAAAQNLADVCAMGARPHSLVVSLAAPAETPASVLVGIMRGLRDEAARAGATVTGGDLSGGPCLVVSVTAQGALHGDPVLRSGAQEGDAVVLVGTVGHAAAGLDLLFDGLDVGHRPVDGRERPVDGRECPVDGSALSTDPATAGPVETQRAPRPWYAGAAALAERAPEPRPAGGRARIAHALIDVSDGLLGDLGRICRASGVSADLDPAAIDRLAAPLLPAARALDHEAGTSPEGIGRPHPDHSDPDRSHPGPAHLDRARHWVLTGGEDHGFLATVPESALDTLASTLDGARPPVPWERIGTVFPAGADGTAPGMVTLGGHPVDGDSFRHFSTAPTAPTAAPGADGRRGAGQAHEQEDAR